MRLAEAGEKGCASKMATLIKKTKPALPKPVAPTTPSPALRTAVMAHAQGLRASALKKSKPKPQP